MSDPSSTRDEGESELLLRIKQLETKQELLETILARCASATAAASYAILVLSTELRQADRSLAYSEAAQTFFRKLDEQTKALTQAVEDALRGD